MAPSSRSSASVDTVGRPGSIISSTPLSRFVASLSRRGDEGREKVELIQENEETPKRGFRTILNVRNPCYSKGLAACSGTKVVYSEKVYKFDFKLLISL